jgi:hypothetical protein
VMRRGKTESNTRIAWNGDGGSGIAAKTLNKQSRTADKGGPPT